MKRMEKNEGLGVWAAGKKICRAPPARMVTR